MFKGSITALVTPFKENQDIDFLQLTRLIELQIEAKTDALVCCGTTGESPTLSDEEHFLIFETAVKTARGRIPIIAGTGTFSTAHTVYRTQEAFKRGVDAALVIVPYYNRPSFEGCLAHFAALDHVGLPLIIYHHPGRTGVTLQDHELATLGDLPSVIGIKEASGSCDTIQFLHQNTSLKIYSGDDALAFSHLESGADGVISIVSNILPGSWRDMIHAFFEHDFITSETIFERMLPLCKALVMETNPQGIKYALSLVGDTLDVMRLPLIPPKYSTQLHIQAVLNSFKTG
ncbi:MAG: 4-hydroxy-tetrahydrodipicolinate synthase [Candidatus Rhabdochlamydia sp.]